MKTERTILVVFDGTSHFIIPKSELVDYKECTVVESFYNINLAQAYADYLNKELLSSASAGYLKDRGLQVP